MWRPRALLSMPVEGLHHLQGVEPGRGVVFSTPHYGPLVGLAALPGAVGTIDAAVGEHLAAATVPAGYNGHQIEQSRRVLVQGGFRPVRAVASARTFTRTLTDGGRVLLNFDVPGTYPVRFLGKTVELMNGTARLAEKTDSVVVPVIPRPRGRGWYVHLDEPIDPREHDSWQSVLQATADVHSRLVLAAPEHLESPLRDGGWAVATADGWRAKAGS
jgi:lauroyl/myristoyl acyltransferase